MFGIAKKNRSPAIFQKLRHLICMESCIQRNRDASCADNSQVSRDPPWMVRCQDGYPRIAFPLPGQPVPNALRHPLKLRKSNALGPVLPLDFESGLFGELPGCFLVAFV